MKIYATNPYLKKIKFKKAKTYEEAEIFAEEKLGLLYKFDFYKPDLSVMNQINESLSKAYNKTGKKAFDEVMYITELEKTNGLKARTTITRGDGEVKKVTLKLNHLLFGTSRGVVNGYVKKLRELGLINSENRITLLGNFQYEHSLNRYYKLHQNGKFSVFGKQLGSMDKARMDYLDLLTKSIEEHERILAQKTSLKKLLKSELNINIPENLTKDEYNIFMTKILLENKNNSAIKSFIQKFRHSRAIGFDRTILHEAGHAYQHRNTSYPNNFKFDDAERKVARNVSRYATHDSEEFAAEEFADLVTNNFTSPQNIKDLYKKCGGYSEFIS